MIKGSPNSKVQPFGIFQCLNQNSSNCSCQFWTEKSIILQFLRHSSFSWHITPLQILSSNIFNFGQKNSIKVPILRFTSALVEIRQILCYFPNQKLVFLQIFHHSLVSWKITPLDFFRSDIITGKDQWKCRFLGLLSARIKIHQIRVIFKTTN